MKPYVIKIPLAILLMAVSVLLFNSCKKTDTLSNKTKEKTEKEKIIEATIERYGAITAPVIYQPHKRATDIAYLDSNGVSHQIGGGIRTEATCGQYDCSTAPTANDLYVSYTLEYVKWYYECPNSSHNLTAIWKISVPYTVTLYYNSPFISRASYGEMRIKQPNGTVLITSNYLVSGSGGNFEIVNNGTDPNCSSNTLFTVSYTWENIAGTYFPGNEVECALNLYNDCAITNYNNTIGFTQGVTYTNADVFTHPCDRTDQAYINPNSGPNNCTTIAGAYIGCSPPSGFTGTNEHQVEYRLRTNSSSNLWDDQPIINSTIYNGTFSSSGSSQVATMAACCDVLYLFNMTPSSGTWLVRYRNRHTGCTPTITLNSNWGGNYVTEVWTL